MPPCPVDFRVKLCPLVVCRLRSVLTVIRPDASRTIFVVPAIPSRTPADIVFAPLLSSFSATVPSPAAVSWVPSPLVPATIVRLSGSSRNVPVSPLRAVKSTVPVSLTPLWLDTSAKPPSPPVAPPLAEMLPAKFVRVSDKTVTLPPLPLLTASAFRLAVLAMLTVFDHAPVPRPFAPSPSLPIATSPPPASPEASMLVPLATTILSPVATMLPPVSPLSSPVALILPLATTVPLSPPDKIIRPLLLETLLAWITPLVLITLSITSLTARAEIDTTPPSARIEPLLLTRASTGLPSAPTGVVSTSDPTPKLSKPSPWKSSEKVFAPPSDTLPKRA